MYWLDYVVSGPPPPTPPDQWPASNQWWPPQFPCNRKGSVGETTEICQSWAKSLGCRFTKSSPPQVGILQYKVTQTGRDFTVWDDSMTGRDLTVWGHTTGRDLTVWGDYDRLGFYSVTSSDFVTDNWIPVISQKANGNLCCNSPCPKYLTFSWLFLWF